MRDITCHLAFVYFNPVHGRTLGLPQGTVVQVRDRNPARKDRILGTGVVEGDDGQVQIVARTELEIWPDLYFEVVTGNRTLEFPSTRWKTGESIVPGIHLGDAWDTRDSYATNHQRGLLWTFKGDRVGEPDEPLTFRVTFDCFVRFVYWNEVRGSFVGLPPGIVVEAMEREHVADDRVLATAFTDDEGRAHLRVDDRLERKPDLYFRTRIPDEQPSWVDLASNTLADGGEDRLELPRSWSTREAFALEAPDRRGFWRNFRGSRIGIAANPYVFDIFEQPPTYVPGNSAASLIDGSELLPAVERVLLAAERTIHLEVMLFYGDSIGERLADLLIARARDGIRVRLLIDFKTTASGYSLLVLKKIWARTFQNLPSAERKRLLKQYNDEMKAEKIRGDAERIRARLHAEPNITLLESSFPYIQLRPKAHADAPAAYKELEEHLPFFTVARIDHRKMWIVDGRTALLGGMNIGQEYLYDRAFDPTTDAADEEWVKWHDCFIELHGPVVREVQKLYRQRWVGEGGDAFAFGPSDVELGGTDPEDPCFPSIEPIAGGLPVRIVRTTPGAAMQFHQAFVGLLEGAKERILIENPYFSTPELATQLVRAARRGVEVTCVFPDHHNDSLDFLYAARMKYPALLEAGIAIYEYGNHMTHAKVAVVDDVTVIGSANLNHASLFNHYEVTAFVRDRGFADGFAERMFARDITVSRRIEPEEVDSLLDITALAKLYVRKIVDVWF